MDSVRALRSKPTNRTAHEVEKDSNLDLILRGSNGAINKLAAAIAPPGKSLAEALEKSGGGASTEVLAKLNQIISLLEGGLQAQVDELTKKLKSSSDTVEDAINQDSEGG